jgi:hypothetical protein
VPAIAERRRAAARVELRRWLGNIDAICRVRGRQRPRNSEPPKNDNKVEHMASDSTSRPEHELFEVKGGLDVLSDLREEFEQWREEEENKAKLETLDNVLAHIEAIEREYRIRQDKLKKAK